ncbi:hypothetical protein GALMADRAFT_147122 [Galerina marginata CBS 339.88]|uniref:Uncharacterized protein n=1 Tax=Galerina marginata (strain CBS 339.88) TaxID=685588 RepID=A0A067S9L2_GALM3|nr:hypothetical protein GALMADRAFT_147122 [Galerina marginata CBS 339.88]
MTEGPPPSAASSSRISSAADPGVSAQSVPQTSNFVPLPPSPAVSNPNTLTHQPYSNYATWSNGWSSTYPVYPPSTSAYQTQNPGPPQQAYYGPTNYNPYAAHLLQPHAYNPPQLPKSTNENPPNTANSQPAKPPTPPARSPTPPLPEPETYKNWDEAIKKFLVKTKMIQTLKGLENDMLMLSPEWEQTKIPEALKELVVGLQSILDRIAKKPQAEEDSMQVDTIVDISSVADPPNDDHSLEDRKLGYVQLSNGTEPRTQSSINKSISQFLSRTRARNNASNRAEFLHSLAEKRLKLAKSIGEENGQGREGSKEHEVTSCARVDAKPIDRDKQITYDIAKYGEGPLTKTVKSGVAPDPGVPPTSGPPAVSPDPPLPVQFPIALVTPKVTNTAGTNSRLPRKRKFGDLDGGDAEAQHETRQGKLKSTRKGKGRAKADDDEPASPAEPRPDGDGEERALSMATAAKHPGIDERLKSLEEHLAIRYVPLPPRTLVARLKYLEDHVIRLEKEYPPWAALHFNQPNRGWPPPPRATPVIVPPHLRSLTTTSTTLPSTAVPHTLVSPTNATATSASASAINPGRGGGPSKSKPRKTNSSLQKAVLERLEVQKAMGEMGGKGMRD